MKALVIAQSEKAAQELCAGAKSLYGETALVVVGSSVETTIADDAYAIMVPEGAVADDAYETVDALIEKLAPEAVLAEASVSVKAIVARIAARRGTAAMTDVTAITEAGAENRFFGGIAVKTQKAVGGLSIYTVPSGVFEAAQGETSVSSIEYIAPACAVKLTASEALPAAEVNLAEAKNVVAAGRGFSSAEQLDLARELCSKVGAELGCTRPLTEAEDWLPRERYIGVSGQMLKPNTYVGIGVSGQMQHMVGVNQAKAIFAINKDKNAAIFKQCDYGLVGDIATVMPQLIESL